MRQYKLVVVGDGTVGKTSLLTSYVEDTFDLEYEATVFDNKETNIKLDGKDHFVCLFDTAGQENFASVRPLSYQETEAFIVCFSVDSDATFNHIGTHWLPELEHHQPGVPTLIVGTKQDLRGERLLKSDDDIDREDGMRTEEYYARKSMSLGAKQYLECSAKTRFNVNHVFETALREALQYFTTKQNQKKAKGGKKGKPKCIVF